MGSRSGKAAFSLALLAALGAAAPAGAMAALPPAAVETVAAGVFVHVGRDEDASAANAGDISNAGFVVGSRCVAVIDTGGSPEAGQALLAAVRQVTPLPVCWVINTHMHPDHVLGNAAFRRANADAAPQFVAHARLVAALAAREHSYREGVQRDFGKPLGDGDIVYPTQTVPITTEATLLDLGGRSIELRAWPTAHTDNDVSVYDRQTRTLFFGDLLFAEHIPVIDGSLRGWLAVMKRLEAENVAIAVPGHGPVSRQWPAALAPQQRYLGALLTETRAAIAAKLTIRQAVETVGTEAAKGFMLADLFHRRNVTTAYAELEWED